MNVSQKLTAETQTRSHQVDIGHGQHEWVKVHQDHGDTLIDTYVPGGHMVSQSRIHRRDDGSMFKRYTNLQRHQTSNLLAHANGHVSRQSEGGGHVTTRQWDPTGTLSTSDLGPNSTSFRSVSRSSDGPVIHNKVRHQHGPASESRISHHGCVREYSLRDGSQWTIDDQGLRQEYGALPDFAPPFGTVDEKV